MMGKEQETKATQRHDCEKHTYLYHFISSIFQITMAGGCPWEVFEDPQTKAA